MYDAGFKLKVVECGEIRAVLCTCTNVCMRIPCTLRNGPQPLFIQYSHPLIAPAGAESTCRKHLRKYVLYNVSMHIPCTLRNGPQPLFIQYSHPLIAPAGAERSTCRKQLRKYRYYISTSYVQKLILQHNFYVMHSIYR